MLKRFVLIPLLVVALTIGLISPIPGLGQVKAATNHVFFYAPHQDDELLSMGVAIRYYLELGYNVHVVLLTDGSATGARRVINGEVYCPWHKRYHNPAAEGYAPLTEADITEARNKEFIESVKALGVPESNIHIHNFKDGTLTRAQMKTLVRWTYEYRYPNAQHKTMSYHDSHPDHKNAGQALLEMYNSGELSNVRFYLKQEDQHRFGSYHPYHSGMYPYLSAAANAYKKWDPANGRFAVGYHSVPAMFDDFLANPRSKWHKPGQ